MKAIIENRLGIVSCLAALILIVAGLLSYQNTQQLILVNGRVTKTNVVLAAISRHTRLSRTRRTGLRISPLSGTSSFDPGILEHCPDPKTVRPSPKPDRR